MKLPKEHFRDMALLSFFNQKKTAAESHRVLVETYGDVAPLQLRRVSIDLNKMVI